MVCRSCGSGKMDEVFSLGAMPLANSLLSASNEPYDTYPLDLVRCEECSLVQLTETVPPEKIFLDYNYLTSCSPPMVEHAEKAVSEVCNIRGVAGMNNATLVVEIGSNDGYLLQHYVKLGIPVLGIDPSTRAADAAAIRRVPTIRDFFSLKMALAMGKQASVIHVHNVLAHVPDINDFVAGLSYLLKPGGLIVIEVPYLGDLLEKCFFDQIYHEHVFYFSLASLRRLLERHGLAITGVNSLHVHGGSLRVFVGHLPRKGAPYPVIFPDPCNLDLLEWAGFRDQVRRNVNYTLDSLYTLREEGQSIAGFGAPAKATVFLNYAKIDDSMIPYVADDTPAKQGKFIPGTGTEVVPVEKWLEKQPSHTIILCWNFAQTVCEKYVKSYNGKFFVWYVLPPDKARSA